MFRHRRRGYRPRFFPFKFIWIFILVYFMVDENLAVFLLIVGAAIFFFGIQKQEAAPPRPRPAPPRPRPAQPLPQTRPTQFEAPFSPAEVVTKPLPVVQPKPTNSRRMAHLYGTCTRCGAPLSPTSVTWHDGEIAACAYCGSKL